MNKFISTHGAKKLQHKHADFPVGYSNGEGRLVDMNGVDCRTGKWLFFTGIRLCCSVETFSYVSTLLNKIGGLYSVSW